MAVIYAAELWLPLQADATSNILFYAYGPVQSGVESIVQCSNWAVCRRQFTAEWAELWRRQKYLHQPPGWSADPAIQAARNTLVAGCFGKGDQS